jgi:3-oxoacyl-[acyl-carrier-protein] synthase II
MGGRGALRSRASELAEVAVTGMAVLTSAGNSLGSFWAALCAGKSTAAPLLQVDTRELPVRFGCEIKDFDPAAVFGRKEARRTDRVSQLASVVGAAAVADASITDVDVERAGVVVGIGFGGAATYESAILSTMSGDKAGPRNALAIPMAMANAPAAHLAMRTGWMGPNMTIAAACASGAHAIGEAARLICDGTADVVLAGGTEAPLTACNIVGFHHLRALSVRNDDPAGASRPFDRQRDGFVLAEAAAFALLESVPHARARGARTWGYLLGYGRNNDAWHIVMPRGDGAGAEACMRLALEESGAGEGDVLFVSAHGTSTALNDRAEAQAISRLFATSCPPVTSVKGCVGHSLGAAGAVGFVATCLGLAAGQVPPIANYGGSEPEIDINIVAGQPVMCKSGTGMAVNNSFGFGGNNVCLAVRGGERRLSQLSASE